MGVRKEDDLEDKEDNPRSETTSRSPEQTPSTMAQEKDTTETLLSGRQESTLPDNVSIIDSTRSEGACLGEIIGGITLEGCQSL